MKKLISISIILFLAAFSYSYAQKENIKNHPGYVEFGEMGSLETGDEVTEVLIEDNLIKLVANMTKGEEPELSGLLGGIKMIRVNSFDITPENEPKVKEKIKKIISSLESKNWQRIVKVKEKGEDVNIYIKPSADNKIDGLLITAFESNSEVSFVNIVGSIDLETIGKLGDKFDIPALNDVKKDTEKK